MYKLYILNDDEVKKIIRHHHNHKTKGPSGTCLYQLLN